MGAVSKHGHGVPLAQRRFLMNNIKTIALTLLFLSLSAIANPLDGYYQITSLVITEDGRPRGFNNTGLYIYASGKRLKIAGAWRGYPMQRDIIVEKTVGDSVFLRDPQNPSSLFRFHIKNNTVSGRHALNYDDGTKQVVETTATVRKLNRGEADKIRELLDF
jgi:hypothetical protein